MVSLVLLLVALYFLVFSVIYYGAFRLHVATDFYCIPVFCVGRDSSVGIATGYGLDGPGTESRWGRDFPHQSRPGPGTYPASCTMGIGSFPGVKRQRRGANHPPPSKCRGHETVGLYLYCTSGPSWPVMGAPLPFHLYFVHNGVTFTSDTSRRFIPISWLIHTQRFLCMNIYFRIITWNFFRVVR